MQLHLYVKLQKVIGLMPALHLCFGEGRISPFGGIRKSMCFLLRQIVCWLLFHKYPIIECVVFGMLYGLLFGQVPLINFLFS